MFILLVLVGLTNAYIDCTDLQQCVGQNLYNLDDIYCYGELACNLGIFGGPDYTHSPACNGAHSCANSTIYNTTEVYAYAALALAHSTIYNSNVSMVVYAEAFYAAYNTTIYCNDGSDCIIYCLGNSCDGMNLICDGTSTCSTWYTQTSVASSMVDAPNYYRGLAVLEPLVYSDNYINGNNIKCYISGFCSGSFNLNGVNKDLYCQSTYSCFANVIGLIGSGNSTVYCSSVQSCSYVDFTVDDAADLTANLVVTGNIGAFGSNFTGFTNIWGLARSSLGNAHIYSNNNKNNQLNLYLGSPYASGTGTTVYCDFGDVCNIYCDTYYSCVGVDVHCYGECNINCDTEIVGYCPDVFYYSTTGGPVADTTTTKTTKTVTMNPIATESTTSNTAIASEFETTKSGLSTGSGEDWSALIRTWEVGGFIAFIMSLTLPIFVSIVAFIYHKQSKYHGCDKPNYFAIFACFWNFGDFYSDLIFTFILISTQNTLWYFAVFFCLVPHFVGNFISLYNIRKWQMYNIYLSKYVHKYDWLIIIVSVLAGFYTSVELARSNIFYMGLFSMQLKRQDYHRLQSFRFVNTVVLEFSNLSVCCASLVTRSRNFFFVCQKFLTKTFFGLGRSFFHLFDLIGCVCFLSLFFEFVFLMTHAILLCEKMFCCFPIVKNPTKIATMKT